MTPSTPSITRSPWNSTPSAPPPELPITTGQAGFDALTTGGLHGIMVLAAHSSRPREFLALALVLGAMLRNPRLGALICAVTLPLAEYSLALAAMWSGVRQPISITGDLSPAELGRVERAWAEFKNGVGRRLRFAEPLPGCPENHRGFHFPAAHILLEREKLFVGGEIDRCLVVIDGLHQLAAPMHVHPDPVADYDQPPRPATDFEMCRWRFEIARDVYRGMRPRNGRQQDPVLAVAGTYRDKQSGLRPNDIYGRLGAEATAVGLLQDPPANRYLPGTARPMDLDVTVGCSEKPESIPLLYDYDTCRFRDGESNAPLGW